MTEGEKLSAAWCEAFRGWKDCRDDADTEKHGWDWSGMLSGISPDSSPDYGEGMVAERSLVPDLTLQKELGRLLEDLEREWPGRWSLESNTDDGGPLFLAAIAGNAFECSHSNPNLAVLLAGQSAKGELE